MRDHYIRQRPAGRGPNRNTVELDPQSIEDQSGDDSAMWSGSYTPQG